MGSIVPRMLRGGKWCGGTETGSAEGGDCRLGKSDGGLGHVKVLYSALPWSLRCQTH